MNGSYSARVYFGDPIVTSLFNNSVADNKTIPGVSFPWGNSNPPTSMLGLSSYSHRPADVEGTTSASTFNPPKDPWGFAGNPIIDDDERVQSFTNEPEIASTTEAAETAEEAIDATGAVELSEAALAGAEGSTPWGMAAIINQQLGAAVSQSIVSSLQNQSSSDYVQNMQQHGLNVGLNADIIRSQQENVIRNQQVGGTIGSFFGPLGALIGHAIAGYSSGTSSQLATAGSFQGWVNPQQTNIVASAQTSSDNGAQTQVNNVSTTNDS